MCNRVKALNALTSRQRKATSWQLIKRISRLLGSALLEDYLGGVGGGVSLIRRDFIFWIRVFR
jgi:hypothetical protein